MTDFKYDGKIELEYHFTHMEDYLQIEKLNTAELLFKTTPLDIMGYFCKYLLDPMGKTIDLMKSICKNFTQMVHLVEEIEKLRSLGRCKLITSSLNQEKATAVIVISFDINLICILPIDLLQYNINIANIKNHQLRELLSQASPLLIKSTDLIDQFIKKHAIFLEKLNKSSPLKELDINFMIDLANLLGHYLDGIMPMFKYFKKLHKINKSFNDQSLFELQNKQLNGNINVKYNISTTVNTNSNHANPSHFF